MGRGAAAPPPLTSCLRRGASRGKTTARGREASHLWGIERQVRWGPVTEFIVQCENDKPDHSGRLGQAPPVHPPQAAARAVKELILHTWGVPCLGGVDLESDGSPIPAVASQRRCITLTQWGTPLRYAMRSAAVPPVPTRSLPTPATGPGGATRHGRVAARGRQQQALSLERRSSVRSGSGTNGRGRGGGNSSKSSRGVAAAAPTSPITKRKQQANAAARCGARKTRKTSTCERCDMGRKRRCTCGKRTRQ